MRSATRHVIMSIAAVAVMIVVAGRGVANPAPATQPAAVDSLDVVAWAIGDWTLDAKWANGSPLRARATYAWGPGHKSVVVHTRVDSDKPGQPASLRDIIVYAIAGDGRLTQYTFPHNGAPRIVAASQPDDSSLLFAWDKPAAPGASDASPVPVRHRYTRIDDGRLRWQAQMQLKGEWHTTVDGEWKRADAPVNTPAK